MSDDADIIVKVDGVHLRQLTGSRDRLQDTHGHGYLHIALYRASRSLLDQHGECRDQHAVQNAGFSLCKSVIMGSDQAQMLVLNPLLKGYDILGHLPYFLDAAAALDIEGVQNLLRLGMNRLLIRDVISDRPHLFPVKLLGIQEHSIIQVGLIDIQIHHTRIRTANLRDIGITESSSYLRGTAPVLDLCLYARIAALDNTRDYGMSLARSLQVGNSLAHSAAGVTLAQPGRDIGMIIIQRLQLLHIDQNYRNIQIPNSRKHIVRSGIGQHLQKYQVNIRRAELVSGNHCLLLGRHHSSVDNLNGIRDRFLERSVLRLKFRYQRRELRKIGS